MGMLDKLAGYAPSWSAPDPLGQIDLNQLSEGDARQVRTAVKEFGHAQNQVQFAQSIVDDGTVTGTELGYLYDSMTDRDPNYTGIGGLDFSIYDADAWDHRRSAACAGKTEANQMVCTSLGNAMDVLKKYGMDPTSLVKKQAALDAAE